MKIIGKKGLSGFAKILLDFMFYSGFAVCASLPWSVRWYLRLDYPNYNRPLYYYFVSLLIVSGILALMLIYEVRKIFETINEKDPFVMGNVTSLKRIALYGMLICLLYISKIIIINTLMTMAIVIVFFTASLISLVLAEVFRQAVIYKEENDFTI